MIWRKAGLALYLCIALAPAATGGLQAAEVELLRTPSDGIQPQAAVDGKGAVHVVYLSGDPLAADIYYVRLEGKAFSKPVRVNSQPGSAIAAGIVRGAHIAVGREGRIHVAWMGSKSAGPRGPNGATPMLYARLNDTRTAFEPQRNVMQSADGLDGGGSIAADRAGNVYVAWHGHGGGQGEENRRVWVARSQNDGRTFGRETAANPNPTGACACCGMRAFTAGDGAGPAALYALYRGAQEGFNRDMHLLASRDAGKTWHSRLVHPWKRNACPMSTATFSQADGRLLAAWETEGQVYYAPVSGGGDAVQPIAAPGGTARRKHPAVAVNAAGRTLLAWVETGGWKQPGSLSWQVFDEAGKPAAASGRDVPVPVWGLATAVARPDGRFLIVH